MTPATETANVPAPARRTDEPAYLRLMESRLTDLRVVLGKLATESGWHSSQIRGQVKLLREWAAKHPVTYDPWVPLSQWQEKPS